MPAVQLNAVSDTDPVDAPRDVWDRWVDLAVYAPVGLAVSIKEDLPRFVRQGRQAVENRVQLARWIGQMAVQQGQRELAQIVEERRRLSEAPEPDAPIVDVEAAPDEPTAAVDVGAPAIDDAPDARGGSTVLAAAELPIEGYESLAALHVVQRLAGLSADELDAVRRFETANRARRTILSKVAQLQGD